MNTDRAEKCPLREDIKQNCINTYKQGILKFMLYIESVLYQNDYVIELINEYKQMSNTNEENRIVNKVVWYLGLTEYVGV